MRKTTPQRSPEQMKQDYAARRSPSCSCTHHNWLTCLAEQEHMSRFNAMITFAKGEHMGRCTCKCHYTADNQQVSEQEWLRNHIREGVSA